MYTITMSTAPIASGAIGVPPSTDRPIVRTRKNVPMSSVRYLFMCLLLRAGETAPTAAAQCFRHHAHPCSSGRAKRVPPAILERSRMRRRQSARLVVYELQELPERPGLISTGSKLSGNEAHPGSVGFG